MSIECIYQHGGITEQEHKEKYQNVRGIGTFENGVEQPHLFRGKYVRASTLATEILKPLIQNEDLLVVENAGQVLYWLRT